MVPWFCAACVKNRRDPAHENMSQKKTKIGTTLIMAPIVITVLRVPREASEMDDKAEDCQKPETPQNHEADTQEILTKEQSKMVRFVSFVSFWFHFDRSKTATKQSI